MPLSSARKYSVAKMMLHCVLVFVLGAFPLIAQTEGEDSMKIAKIERLLSKLERGEQVTIVALGDSNTELTFHTRGYLNWPYLLQEALFEKYGANKVIMINAACCGEGAPGGLARLEKNYHNLD